MVEPQDKASVWERHAQTVLVLLLVALLLWVGNTTQQTAVAVAEMRVEINFLKVAIESRNAQILNIENRLSDIERRLNNGG